MNDLQKGSVLTLVASSLWAIGFFVRKQILSDIGPLWLTCLNGLVAAFAVKLWFRISLREALNAFRSNFLRTLGVAITGVTIGTTLILVSLDRIDLSTATLLEKVQPVFAIVLAWIFLKEKIHARAVIWGLIALASSYGITALGESGINPSETDLIGILAILGAALSWAVAGVLAKPLLKNIEPPMLTFLRFTAGSIILLPFAIAFENLVELQSLSFNIWVVIAVTAIISTAIGYVLFYRGLKLISASLSSLLELITPVLAVILGIVFLEESFSFLQFFLAATLLSSTYKLSTQE